MSVYTIIRVYEVPADSRIEATERMLEALEERLFSTKMDGLTVWVIEDAIAFTLMYPEDY